ncbi:MAG TPA: hypothetical protein VKA30_05670 [Actinomycetota bacterium]|nr:hypothetical protein [Actinomycetota bacterium]
MLLFRSEEHVDRWCRDRGMDRGGLLSLAQLGGLAWRWHADRLSASWHRKTPDEAQAIFDDLGLTGPFWRLAP